MTGIASHQERTISYEINAAVDTIFLPGALRLTATTALLAAGIITRVTFGGNATAANVTSCRIHDFSGLDGLPFTPDFVFTGDVITANSIGSQDCRDVVSTINAPFLPETWLLPATEPATANLQAAFNSNWEGRAICLRGMALVFDSGTTPHPGFLTITYEPYASGANRNQMQSKQLGQVPIRM